MLMRMYHAAIWGNGAWTTRKAKESIESLFVPAPQTEDEDDE
jgi:hypothetical protein